MERREPLYCGLEESCAPSVVQGARLGIEACLVAINVGGRGIGAPRQRQRQISHTTESPNVYQ